MPSFFDSDDDEDVPRQPARPRDRDRDSLPNHASSSSRAAFPSSPPSLPTSSTTFTDRLKSTVGGGANSSRRNARSSSTGFTTVDTESGRGSSRGGIKRYNLGDDDDDVDEVNSYAPTSTSGYHLPTSEGDFGLDHDNGDHDAGLEDFEPFEFADDNDVKRFIRVWMRERGTRDIMLWEGDLLETILYKVEQQVRRFSLSL
jgi:hypothetical protein